MAGDQEAASFSVVIPAHDEASTIGRCLDALLADARPGEIELVVVANGCTDATADVARAVPGVRVVELEQGSKIAALNAGDDASTAFPRLYVDADIELGTVAARATADALRGSVPHAASPTVRFAVADRPWSVRGYFWTFEQLPYARVGLVGLGVYGLSAAGRARFGVFPDVTSDDLFVQRQFSVDEREVLSGHRFLVQTPYTLRSLLTVRTRSVQGAEALSRTHPESAGATHSTGETLRELFRLAVRHPARLPAIAAYLGVTLESRRRARSHPHEWHRDESTRR